MAERCKACVCGRSLAGVAGSNPARGMDVSVLCVLYSKGQMSKPGQRSRDKVQRKKIPPGSCRSVPCERYVLPGADLSSTEFLPIVVCLAKFD